MNDISRHILILLGISLAMSSCAEFSMQDGKAELYPPVFKVDTQVEEITQTKGDPGVPELTVPATQDIHFTVKDKNGKTVYDKKGVWSEALKMPVGSYTVEASYGSNTFRAPYYKGSCSGTIVSGEEETPSITMSLCNALLATTLSEGLALHFKADEQNPVRISTSSSSLDAGLGTYIFAPAGESLTVAISGQSSAGVDKTITHTIAPLTPATASYITCDMTTTNAPVITLSGTTEAWGSVGYLTVSNISFDNISTNNQSMLQYNAYEVKTGAKTTGAINGSEITFTGLTPGETYNVYAEIGALKSGAVSMSVVKPEITISERAHHTTNASSELDGTDFTASINIPEKFKSITTVALTLCSSDKAIRSTSLSSGATTWISDGSEHPKWPYLPKGDYSITGTVTQKGTSRDLGAQTITLNEPEFSIVSEPIIYTSYTVYNSSVSIDGKAAGATGANTLDGSSIYIKKGRVSIADAILSNANYSGIINYAYSNGEDLNEDQNSGLTWGEHTVSSSFTFDGVTKHFKNVPCHVTGLPYKISFNNNTTPSNWSIDNCGTNNNYLVLKRGNAYAITCAYHIPKNIFCKGSLTAYAYGGSVYKSYKPTVAIHASETGSNSTTNAQLSGTNSLPGNASFSTIESGRIELSRDVRKICIYTSGSGSNFSVGYGDMGVVCKEFSINYTDSQ